MSLRNVDFGSAIRRIADQRIEEAMAAGKFNNLAGFGKELELEPLPADENARAMWWALRIMKQNDVLPEEVQWRKAIDHLRLSIDRLTDEQRLAELVEKVNVLVRRLNTLGTNAINIAVKPIDYGDELRQLRERRR